MLPGETRFNGAPDPVPCDICKCTEFPLRVCRSAAGFFVGTQCKQCGAPESRESGYYEKREDAEKALLQIRLGDLTETRATQAGETPGVGPISE